MSLHHVMCHGKTLHVHSKKRTTCSGLMKTALNNVLLPTLFKAVNNIVQHCYTCLQANSGSSTCSVLLTTLKNVGSTTLFNPVFTRPEQVVRFLLCIISEGEPVTDEKSIVTLLILKRLFYIYWCKITQ